MTEARATADTTTDTTTDIATTDGTTPAPEPIAPEPIAPEPPEREHAAWRAARERELREPHGWLSPTALLWPTAEPRRLPGVPGQWWVADGRLYTRPVPGDTSVLAGGLVVRGGPTSVSVAEGRGLVLGTFLPPERSGAAGPAEQEVAVEVVRRTGRYAVRLRDPQAPTRTGFTGVPTFAYDPAWVLDAPVRWYDRPVPLTVGAAQPRLVHRVEAVGEVEVRHDHVLLLTGSLLAPRLLFTDEAEGVAPWRVVRAGVPGEMPAASDTLRLDLNRATNQPFVFTAFGTCPAPVAGNHLPFPVTAGERLP
ncbi:DUF1684 domain-containing protein [Promicromonospora thailandica]|uniref:DUF1684 domain-containing protein n=1 Tax=Promicromonospora thailandica TaxID=765201 RepID=A0A9X2G746_9MICO|nr:DUF1684 domain-containing protein [Promicromonospora thailandica]MCP2266803.1 hypothetical protein [Promicromonospora thailandica]BFF21974.1 DUF1684 domain-containing protein [Promicromonospora thailandica]